MINIHTKSQTEILEEERKYASGATMAGGGAIKKSVCPTYLVKKDGTRVDTRDLTEQDIMTLTMLDLQDFVNPQGTYKNQRRPGLDAFKLADIVKTRFKPSYDAVIQMLEWEDVFGHMVVDLQNALNAADTINKARIIIDFSKDSIGDFTRADNQELIVVIQQMKAIEVNRRQQSSHRR